MKLPPQGEANWENRTLFHGDNLKFLRAMNSKSVHLIATDPPFNKGKDFHATPDSLSSGASFHDRWSWEENVHEEWVESITDDWPLVMNVIQGSRNSYGDDMGAFLCYMAVRLIAMHRVLRDDGSLYLHCDPTASHYLKMLLDAIFGKQNFRNEIVWRKYAGRKNNAKHKLATQKDSILFYAKSRHISFSPVFIPHSPKEIEQAYMYTDESGRRYRLSRGGQYQVTGVQKRIYLSDSPGRAIGDLWVEDGLQLNTSSAERTGYPTQKPLALYERIIKASSNKGDIVLDPFCGCATTCVAAERLERQWVGIDIWEKAHEIVIKRLQKEGMLAVPESDRQDLWRMFGEIKRIEEVPERTDDGDTAAPFLRTKKRVHEPPGPRMTHAEMREHLLEQHGCRCRGCGRSFDDPRYLELDHNTPRADGGINHVSNRVLLCGPCNRAKSHRLTLSGLQELNRKKGWMAEGAT